MPPDVVPPMLEQARGLRCYAPIIRIGKLSPLVYLLAHSVDDRRVVVLLLCGRKPLPLVEHQRRLLGRSLALLGLRDGCDELGPPSDLDDLLRWLPLAVKLPMAQGMAMG